MVTVQRGVSHGQQRGGVDAAAPHQRPDTGQKFAGGKGLGEIIVRPGVQTGHPVGHLRLGGQKQGGGSVSPCAGGLTADTLSFAIAMNELLRVSALQDTAAS